MLLILCVDLDDDLGRKTGFDTPVVGRDEVEAAAVSLANSDPEDSDVNVCFQGVHLYDTIEDESVEVAVVTGSERADVAANRKVGEEVDTVLASLSTGEDVKALVLTDGAQDESVLPVIRSRVPIDGVRRVVVRQAQDLESMYYTFKQLLADPETRGTILVPLGILLLIYPAAIFVEQLGLPGSALGLTSALLGLYVLFRGLGLEETVDETVEQIRVGLFGGRVQVITYIVALALIVVGGVGGIEVIETISDPTSVETAAGFVFGAVQWGAAAGVVAAIGHITDAYLDGSFRWRHLNAPFYVLSIAIVLHGTSAYFLSLPFATLSYLAVTLTTGTLLGLASTLAFAVAEQRYTRGTRPTA